jgi:hypothetical protein
MEHTVEHRCSSLEEDVPDTHITYDVGCGTWWLTHPDNKQEFVIQYCPFCGVEFHNPEERESESDGYL